MLLQSARALLLPSMLTFWLLQQHNQPVLMLSNLSLRFCRAFFSLSTLYWPVCCGVVPLRVPSEHWMTLWLPLSGCGMAKRAVSATRSIFADRPSR